MKLFLLPLALLLSFISYGQSVAEKAVQKLDSFAIGYPQEKVFVHTDRNAYLSGETIWLAAYALAENKPSYLSKVVYVELAGADGKVREKRMLPLSGGAAKGEINLGKDLPSGTYYINAYTLWMLNFPGLVYSRTISVYNVNPATKNNNQQAAAEPLVGLYPEGGDLIAGVTNRVAFKVMMPDGRPAEIKGELLNQEKVVLSFSTVHDGMGSFQLETKAGAAYSVRITANGKTKTVKLPPTKEEGIAMQVMNETASRLFVQLQRGPKNAEAYKEVTIVAQISGEPVFTSKVTLEDGPTTLPVSKKDLPAGIMQITVFSDKGMPLAERLVFIANHTLQPPVLNVVEQNTAARKKNELSINLGQFKNPQASVSVVNFSIDSANYESNMLAAIYLTADLGGNIHQPGYYFKDKEPGTLQALDLLLLTRGWRRFNWQDLMADHYPKLRYPVESGITVAGKLTKIDGKSQINNGRIDFITKTEDSTTILTTVRLNQSEEFLIPDLNFKKQATIYYQGTNEEKQKSLTNVEVYPSFFDTLTKSANGINYNLEDYVVEKSAGMNALLEDKKQWEDATGNTLQTVTVRAKKQTPVDSLNRLYATDIFLNSDQTIPMDKGKYYSIWQFIQRNVPGIDIGKDQYGQSTVYFTRYTGVDALTTETGGDSTTNIKFFLNEVEVSKDIIETVDPMDLSLVKVWKGASASILGASRGAIGIYTQKVSGGRDWRSKAFNFFKKQGYSVTREFYNLDYSILDPATLFSDIRPTLYWNPTLKTDKNGNASIRFYNDDMSKSFRIVINGVDENGKLIYEEKIVR